MPILSGTHCCSNCKEEISWQCSVDDGSREYNVYVKTENQRTYTPIILSTPQAKVHVLCFVCEECGQIDIVKEKSRNIHNLYKRR